MTVIKPKDDPTILLAPQPHQPWALTNQALWLISTQKPTRLDHCICQMGVFLDALISADLVPLLPKGGELSMAFCSAFLCHGPSPC